MSQTKHGSNSPFHQKHLYLGSPLIIQTKAKPVANFHLSQPYVPAINISLKNQLSINLMKGGSQTFREQSSISKKVAQMSKKPVYHEKVQSHKSFQTVRSIEPRENNFVEQDSLAARNAAYLQMQLEKQLSSTKPKPKSMDQYSSVIAKSVISSKPLNSKLSTEPGEPVTAVPTNHRSDSQSQTNIMQLIQKINSKKQSLVKSPQHQQPSSDVLSLNFKKLLNDYNIKPTDGSATIRQKSEKKHDDIQISGFKTERQVPESTVSILMFEKDNTVTEYKFDAACGTTDQLIKFLMSQQKSSEQQIIGFSTIDKNIAIDYYLSLHNRSLEPLQKLTIKLAPIHKEEPTSQLSLKSFHFLQCVGMGGFSRVYLVRSKSTGHFLALKMISKQFIIENQKQQIVQNERDVMVQLSTPDCRFICKVECAFETKSWVCFGMEYCPGGELFNQLRKVKRMSEDQARVYFIQVCAAVQFLHTNHVLYRDIKPENILLDENGFLKLADFGLARPNMTAEDEAYSFCGSPEYMAPEMLQQQGHNYSVDYYCLGALLYELLTGLPPYYSRDTNKIFQSILYENLQFPQGLVSSSARDLIRKLLAKDPEERLGTYGGIKSIISHPWVQSVNVEQVVAQKVKPPFPANLISFNFDPSEFRKGEQTFKQELKRSLTSADELIFKPIFKEFYYVGARLKQERTNPPAHSIERLTYASVNAGEVSSRRVNSANTHFDQVTRTGSANSKQQSIQQKYFTIDKSKKTLKFSQQIRQSAKYSTSCSKAVANANQLKALTTVCSITCHRTE